MDDGAERATHLVKRPWTPEEDEALVAAVTKYGACRWSMIATHLESGRVGKQCRERWNNCLLYTSPSPRDKRQSRMPSSA